MSELCKQMFKMPHQMMSFSRGLRSLYAEYAVCKDGSTAKFREVRDAVRDDTVVYVTKVLPHANSVILNIKEYFNNFVALEFEDWLESLEEIVKELEDYEKASILLAKMHERVMLSLIMRQDEVNKSIVGMEKLSREKKDEREPRRNQEQAKIEEGYIQALKKMVGYFPPETTQRHFQTEAEKIAQFVADNANVKIARKAADITERVIIPSIIDFLTSLLECKTFFVETKSRLTDLGHPANDNAENSRKMRQYFDVMQKAANDINALCKAFFGSITEVSKILYNTYSVFIFYHIGKLTCIKNYHNIFVTVKILFLYKK